MGTGVEDMGDGAVNRYALDQLPSEVERIADWVRLTVADVTGEFSEWSDEERERLRRGASYWSRSWTANSTMRAATFRLCRRSSPLARRPCS